MLQIKLEHYICIVMRYFSSLFYQIVLLPVTIQMDTKKRPIHFFSVCLHSDQEEQEANLPVRSQYL